jgi:hypothetical protein
MTLYMNVTKDELELPLAVADTVAELAKMVGVRENSIFGAMGRAKKSGCKCAYVRVEIDEEE